VCKAYANVQAVDGLSFEAKAGEIFGLIGPNGAGKSTTIRMIMNIIAPDSGTIRFDGAPLAEADFDRACVALRASKRLGERKRREDSRARAISNRSASSSLRISRSTVRLPESFSNRWASK